MFSFLGVLRRAQTVLLKILLLIALLVLMVTIYYKMSVKYVLIFVSLVKIHQQIVYNTKKNTYKPITTAILANFKINKISVLTVPLSASSVYPYHSVFNAFKGTICHLLLVYNAIIIV